MEKLKIMIASPVRRRPDILTEFLHGLASIDGGDHELIFRLVDDNDDPASTELLKSFQAMQAQKGISAKIEQADRSAEIPFQCNENTHIWNEMLVWRVAKSKDGFIRQARDERVDALLLVDSDIVLHPGTLLRLLETGKPIVSEIFWTQWQPGTAPLPQVWLSDEYDMVSREPGTLLSDAEIKRRTNEFLAMLRTPGLYQVGGLGACTLIGSEALRFDLSFRKIRNLSLWGEDRHFCIRAECLGFDLFVDTTLPALHLYRTSDIGKLPAQRVHWRNMGRGAAEDDSRPRLLLSMTMRNEAKGHLREMLARCKDYIDAASIIDDGSTDGSADICRQALAGIPLRIVRNDEPKFGNEYELRQQQWAEAAKLNPQWVLVLDADEWFEDRFKDGLSAMLEQEEIDVYSFRIYDFWADCRYREDEHWNSHGLYRPLLVRYRPHFPAVWSETPVHCGRMPWNIFSLPNAISPFRLKHMGWAKESERRRKYERYNESDPDGSYGSKAQYESIMDANPLLVEWSENG